MCGHRAAIVLQWAKEGRHVDDIVREQDGGHPVGVPNQVAAQADQITAQVGCVVGDRVACDDGVKDVNIAEVLGGEEAPTDAEAVRPIRSQVSLDSPTFAALGPVLREGAVDKHQQAVFKIDGSTPPASTRACAPALHTVATLSTDGSVAGKRAVGQTGAARHTEERTAHAIESDLGRRVVRISGRTPYPPDNAIAHKRATVEHQ